MISVRPLGPRERIGLFATWPNGPGTAAVFVEAPVTCTWRGCDEVAENEVLIPRPHRRSRMRRLLCTKHTERTQAKAREAIR